MSRHVSDEALRDAEKLASRISPHDYGTLKIHWEMKSYALIAHMLRRYGFEYKGLAHLETLVEEVIRTKEE